jgi:hypothetical protein
VVFLLVRDRLQFDAGLIVSGPSVVNIGSLDVEEIQSSADSGTELGGRP